MRILKLIVSFFKLKKTANSKTCAKGVKPDSNARTEHEGFDAYIHVKPWG